ncbi:MAG: STAS domain-containing protein [Brevinematales bacterium]
MQYERKIENNAAIYCVHGDFTIFFLNNIKGDIEKDVAAGKISYFVFDFSDVHYIDSAAISLLIMTGKYNDAHGHKLYIRCPKDVVKRIIDNAELTFVEYQY